ncbi:MAG: hypothetical protein IKT98_10480 [Selenomonadaceae bacterium]|nr:hypothetical protein [Selenomonadaceae bacterium]
MVDLEKLDEGLSKLTGLDYEEAARAERATGNNAVALATDERFLIRLAAIALETNANELKALPIKDYMLIYSRTLNFLFTSEATPT